MNLERDPRSSPLRFVARGMGLALARLRFLLLIGAVLLLVAYWPTLRYYWERLTRPAPFGVAVSSETEYWCPMCPGVASDWPSKCPVCHMTLIRRLKGEMTPLPDGVVARVQLSPYRQMLAGIHTSPVEFRRLEQEVVLAGRLAPVPAGFSTGPARMILSAEVFAHDAPLVRAGLAVEVVCDAFPGELFTGRIDGIEANNGTHRARVVVDDQRGRLRSGQYAMARVKISAARLDANRDMALERWRDATTAELMAAALESTTMPAAIGPLLESGVRLALLNEGRILAVPESAVIDTGTRQVVFVEQMPGIYDAVEVRLGRRCGDHYPVHWGLEAGQRVVTAGSVLLDAETRLNPSVAASYFGAGLRGPQVLPAPAGALSPEDRLLAQKQRICPVTEAPLDSMGGPIRVMVNGKPVFICCEGCRQPLLKEPSKYLPRIKNK